MTWDSAVTTDNYYGPNNKSYVQIQIKIEVRKNISLFAAMSRQVPMVILLHIQQVTEAHNIHDFIMLC
jgi:hypothetical protein